MVRWAVFEKRTNAPTGKLQQFCFATILFYFQHSLENDLLPSGVRDEKRIKHRGPGLWKLK